MRPSPSALSLFLLLAVSDYHNHVKTTHAFLTNPSLNSGKVVGIGRPSQSTLDFLLLNQKDLQPSGTDILTFSTATTTSLNAGFLGQDEKEEEAEEDEEDEDEEDDEEDDETEDEFEDNFGEDMYKTAMENIRKKRQEKISLDADDENYVQTMSPEERRENLNVVRQIYNADLGDLLRRKDYAGWLESKNDLDIRKRNDPWFRLNIKLKDAVELDEREEAERLKKLIEQVGGPPPGVKSIREYARNQEIYDRGISISRAESMLEFEQRQRNRETWKKMMAEREAIEAREAEELLNNPYDEYEEGLQRRERMMKKLYGNIEEKRKKTEQRAMEIQKKYKDKYGDLQNMTPLDRALMEAKNEAEKLAKDKKKKKALSGKGKSASSSKSSRGGDDDRPRMPGDNDVMTGEIETEILESSSIITDILKVEVSSKYNSAQSDPPMRKHCFQYTIKITNNSPADTVQLRSRRFEIQTVGALQKDVVQGQGITGRQPILKPGETFEYTSTAPLSVRPIGTTIIAARMRGTYSYSIVDEKSIAEEREIKEAELGTFHFVFPPEQRVKPVISEDDDDDDEEDEEEEDDDDDEAEDVVSKTPKSPPTTTSTAKSSSSTMSPPTTLPGDSDMYSGDLDIGTIQDASETSTDSVRVSVTSQYREERSDAKLQKHFFAYNIRITNERSSEAIQLVSRRFEIQTIGSNKKDVVQGPGVTGRQPVLQPGESFEYTSTAPLSVKPMDKTPVVARMSGEYSFMVLGEDGKSPISSEALKAKLGLFHFILPQVA